MSSFNVGQGGVNTRPGSRRVPEQVQTDGPGFSLCAVPLESSGPGFRGVVRGRVNERRSGGVPDQRRRRGLRARGEVKVVILIR